MEFASASARSVNTERVALELLEAAYGTTTPDCDLILVASAVGHDIGVLSSALMRQCPGSRVVATSCAGVVGREGPGESAYDVAMLGIRGEGWTLAQAGGLSGSTAREVGAQLGRQLSGSPQRVHSVYLIASGIDTANDRLVEGLEAELGADVVVFGATSSDQMQGIATFEAVDGIVAQHSAYAVGWWDPSLDVVTMATHGFVAEGEPKVVTAAEGNRIIELDGQPAWPAYLDWLGLPPSATEADTIPIGALAEELPAALAVEYGNPHVLRVVTSHTPAGHMVYSTDIAVGTRLWLTRRDEDLIFRDMERMLKAMTADRSGDVPVAVFQADCLARGRRLFDRVMKEELVQLMQAPFTAGGTCAPWLGMYGFGEFALLGGRNAYHNYTTALAALYRRTEGTR